MDPSWKGLTGANTLREPSLKGKALYNWPPFLLTSLNQLVLTLQTLFTFLQNKLL